MDLVLANNQTMSSSQLANILGYEKKEVNRKIKDMFRGKIEGGEISPTLRPNGQVSDYHLPELESKMFVAKHDINYLERITQFWMDTNKQIALPSTNRQKAKEIVDIDLHVAELFGTPKHLAIIEVVKSVKNDTGIDYSELAHLSISMDSVSNDDKYLEPKELGLMFGLSGQKVNRALMIGGYQDKSEIGWTPTEKGEGISSGHSWSKGSKSGYNYKWNISAVSECLREVAA